MCDDNKMDKCVCCSKETEYSVNEHINNRKYYVEGSGQLCKSCWNHIYSVLDNSWKN